MRMAVSSLKELKPGSTYCLQIPFDEHSQIYMSRLQMELKQIKEDYDITFILLDDGLKLVDAPEAKKSASKRPSIRTNSA